MATHLGKNMATHMKARSKNKNMITHQFCFFREDLRILDLLGEIELFCNFWEKKLSGGGRGRFSVCLACFWQISTESEIENTVTHPQSADDVLVECLVLHKALLLPELKHWGCVVPTLVKEQEHSPWTCAHDVELLELRC